MTFAIVADWTVTLLTFAVTEEVSGEFSWALMTEANCVPFWSSATRLATGVCAEKNVVQFFSISAAAPDAGPEEVAAGEDVGLVAVGEELGDEEPPPLLPHAARTRPRPQIRTGAVNK